MLKDDYFRIYTFLCFNFLKSLNPPNAQTHAPMFPCVEGLGVDDDDAMKRSSVDA
ncbi:hypothetical protein HanPSC8_Chr09g0397641 [Helianthus annuus]|nr:hypothetical protein HanPSC8_Chr09g0397641 [Helianthus annuus]